MSSVFKCNHRSIKKNTVPRSAGISYQLKFHGHYIKTQKALAVLEAYDPHPPGITPAHDPKWPMDKFSQEGLVEFGHPRPISGWSTEAWMR